MLCNATYISKAIPLPEYVIEALSTLESSGFEAWCVGGCVRDALLERHVNDYDIATNARWEDVERVMASSGFAVHRTGAKHGTVTVSRNGHAMEITTYRADGEYTDGRHPDCVEFVRTIEEDLARRDFTINAMAYHPDRGILDCWGGMADLDAGMIRVVGDGNERFSEDALRILRGCRFASQLGFSLEADTKQAMWSHKMRMSHVSAERITHELTEMLLGEHVRDALMECIDIIGAVLPEVVAMKGFEQHTPYHIYDVWEHTAWVVQRSPRTPLGRWAALLHDSGKPGAFFMDGDRGHFYGHPLLSVEIARGALSRLSLSPAFVADVLTLVRLHDKTIPATTKAVKRTLAEFGGDIELFRTLIGIKKADALAQSALSEPRIQLASDLEVVLDNVIASQDAFTIGQLAVNGKDIMSLGVPEGPRVGGILSELLSSVIDEKLPNDRNALLDAAASIAKTQAS
ncbi:MAG: HD domain-containing protein [Eggerthellaceae bacterium]|nr:HD domain-containing protein [Eggerthellaceae bacterium]